MVERRFDAIGPGSKVRLEVAERESDQGWQATTVRLVGKHHRSRAIWRTLAA